MTQAEELELLELEEEEAKAAHAAPQKPGIPTSTPSEAGSALRGVQQFGSLGFGDEIGAGVQALASGFEPGIYTRARDENRAEAKAAREAHPGYYYGAGAAATLPTVVAGAPFKAAQGAGLLSRAIIGAGNGLALGAAAGAGDSEAKDAPGVIRDAETSGLAGAAAGGALPVAGAAARRLYRSFLGAPVRHALDAALNGLDKRAPAIAALKALGVDTSRLSTGQLAPGGHAQALEEAVEAGSPGVRGIRQGGREAWQDAVLQRAAAPGSGPVQGADIASKLESANQSFGPAYDPIAASPVTTAGPGEQSIGDQLRKSFRGSAADRGVLATDAERASIADWLDNQASVPGYTPGVQPTAGPLLKMRSNIRGLSRTLQGADARKGILGNAEDAVTQHLEKNLTPEQAQALQDIDNQYRRHLLISGAASRANGAPAGFTPAQLEGELKGALGKHAFARGGGEDLRQLADRGRETFDTVSPPTGVRALMSKLPQIVREPAALYVNTPTGRALMLGESPAQVKARALIQALRASPTAQRLGGAALREPSLLLGQESR